MSPAEQRQHRTAAVVIVADDNNNGKVNENELFVHPRTHTYDNGEGMFYSMDFPYLYTLFTYDFI